jgi:hypothetical protein
VVNACLGIIVTLFVASRLLIKLYWQAEMERYGTNLLESWYSPGGAGIVCVIDRSSPSMSQQRRKQSLSHVAFFLTDCY